MSQLNNRINLDRAVGAGETASKGEEPMRNSSPKTPWHLRFAPGAVLRQIGLAVLTLTMLVGVQNAEAQSPTIDVYGVDATWENVYIGGQQHEMFSTINSINPLSSSAKGYATWRYENPYNCTSSFNYFEKRRAHATVWYRNGTHRNRYFYADQYDENCPLERHNFLEGSGSTNAPPIYLEEKAMVVGTIETYLSPGQMRGSSHLTKAQLTATHTSGTKNFTVTVKYRVEGSSTVTTVQHSVILKPSRIRIMTLSVPGGDSWATIDSITVHENRPPVVVPVPVPPPAHRPRG